MQATRAYSSNRQVHSIESHKYGDEREQNRQKAANRSGRCIAQNYINTEMNENRTDIHQQIQTDSRSRQ
ncbi:hypothetical protein Tco_1564137 [Tanacetum coccineum]